MIRSFTGLKSISDRAANGESMSATPLSRLLPGLTPECRSSTPFLNLLLPEPVQRLSLIPKMSTLYSPITLASCVQTDVSHMVLTFHAPIRTVCFALKNVDFLGLRLSRRLSAAVVSGGTESG